MALAAFVLVSLAALPAAAAGSAAPPIPLLHGKAAVVYDATSGKFLYSQNGSAELPMASLTKMMTAFVALRDWHDNMSRKMVVPKQVSQVYGTMIYLQPGEVYTFKQLMLAMLLDSANDAAVAIAVNVGGSQKAFVAQMNQDARLLGLTHTHFVNVDGLDAPGHYSSARDLALLGAADMTDPVFRQIVDTRHATIPWPAKHSVRQLYNINEMLTIFPGADGIKTGYTTNALNCVVASANKGGHEVIAVVMGETRYTVWQDESALLAWGLKAAQADPLLPPPPTLPMVFRLPAAQVASLHAVPRSGPGGAPWALVAGVAGVGGVAAAIQRNRRPRRWRWRGFGGGRRMPRMPRMRPIPYSHIARDD